MGRWVLGGKGRLVGRLFDSSPNNEKKEGVQFQGDARMANSRWDPKDNSPILCTVTPLH